MPLLLIAAIAVKAIRGIRISAHHTWREALAAGILMCPRLSLIIAAAAIGEKLGVIDESINAGIVLVAIATVTASPLAFLKVFPAPAGESRTLHGRRYPSLRRHNEPRTTAFKPVSDI